MTGAEFLHFIVLSRRLCTCYISQVEHRTAWGCPLACNEHSVLCCRFSLFYFDGGEQDHRAGAPQAERSFCNYRFA